MIDNIPFLFKLKNNKNYIYNNINNYNDEIVHKYSCRILIILNLIHILYVYIGLYLGLFIKNKKYLIFILISYLLFYILSFYTSGCWISLPEIILNNNYNCTKRYKFSFILWKLRDILLPNITTTILLYFPLIIFVLYKILK